MKVIQLLSFCALALVTFTTSLLRADEVNSAVPAPVLKLMDDPEWVLQNDELAREDTGSLSIAFPGSLELRYAAGSRGSYMHGFRRMNDSAADWLPYQLIRFELYLPEAASVSLDVRLVPHGVELVEEMISTHLEVVGEGWHTIRLPWSVFDFESARTIFLRTVQGVRIEVNEVAASTSDVSFVQIRGLEVCLGSAVALQTPVKGQAVVAGGSVHYPVQVSNCTDVVQRVTLSMNRFGWESMEANVEPKTLVLQPYASAECLVRVKATDRIPGGGHEVQTLQAIPNGQGGAASSLTLTTSVEFAHPYILHTAERWAAVREKVENYEWAREAADKYIAQAKRFSVPEPALKDPGDKFGPYVFKTQNEHGLMASSYAYQLTGEVQYAEKVKAFLLRLSDPEQGFPKTLRACHQSFVQEGHFFQHMAMAYDMSLPAGIYSELEQKQIEHTFRLYMENVQLENLVGAINNWNVSEIVGAFYCALVLQDLERADYFFSAPAGIKDQFAKGVMDDGWWYECSIGYNVWCASEFTQVALAYEPFGVNFREMWVPASYAEEALLSAPGGVSQLNGGVIKRGANLNSLKRPFGMSKELWGPIRNPYRKITHMWDSLLPFLDYRSVMFGVNDAAERKVGAEGFELAYFAYRDPAYAAIIQRSGDKRDLIYGVPELPEETPELFRNSAYADNVGVVMLRSQTEDRPIDEQIQSVLHYGTHGWAHGHYDRTGLLSLMRYGRSFFNPEMVWYGYASFMYKFYVQSSIAKNMVVVDRKIQEASPGARLLFYSGEMMQATVVETTARWSYPPYGGMLYDYLPYDNFKDKIWAEGRSMPHPEEAPAYASMTGFTEPVLQRRAMVVLDDYVLLADYVRGTAVHTYENLLQMKGFQGLKGDSIEQLRHDAQWDTDPINAAQFITDVDVYAVEAPVQASFKMLFGPGADNAGTRTEANEAGPLNFEVFSLWPQQQEIRVGTTPEDHGVRKQLFYTVRGDDVVLEEGQFGAWILGESKIDVAVDSVEVLKLETRIKVGDKPTVFWADAHIVTADGKRIALANLPIEYTNVKQPKGPNVDYYGGPVKIVGIEYLDTIPGQPAHKDETAIVTVDLSQVNASRFVATLGGDYPLGDEAQRRKTFAVRGGSDATMARFLTLIEPHEGSSVVSSAEALDADTVRVVLADGREQLIQLKDLTGEGAAVEISVEEYRDGQLLRSESSSSK